MNDRGVCRGASKKMAVADEPEVAGLHPHLREVLRMCETGVRDRFHVAIVDAIAEAPDAARSYVEKILEGMEANLPAALLRGDLPVFKLISDLLLRQDCETAKGPLM